MAGYKKTILDVVKNVDEMNTSRAYSNDPDISKYLHESSQERKEVMKEKTIPGLVKGALSEENPTATIVKNASQSGAKKSHILDAQNYFVDIGYMHPSEVDGKPGKQFRGMVSRWNKNAGVSKEAIFDAMETWKDNIFGGD
jgi:hypothetical protein